MYLLTNFNHVINQWNRLPRTAQSIAVAEVCCCSGFKVVRLRRARDFEGAASHSRPRPRQPPRHGPAPNRLTRQDQLLRRRRSQVRAVKLLQRPRAGCSVHVLACSFRARLEAGGACVRCCEASMRNGFGLKYVHRFFNVPFLKLQVSSFYPFNYQDNVEDSKSICFFFSVKLLWINWRRINVRAAWLNTNWTYTKNQTKLTTTCRSKTLQLLFILPLCY